MTEAEYRRTKKRVTALSRFWKDRLLPQWHLELIFLREAPERSNSVASDHGMVSVMTVDRSWSYKRASVKVVVPAVVEQELDDDELEYHFVHELCHAMLHEMRAIVPAKCANCGSDRTFADGDMEHEEHVVTELATAILGIKRANRRLN